MFYAFRMDKLIHASGFADFVVGLALLATALMVHRGRPWLAIGPIKTWLTAAIACGVLAAWCGVVNRNGQNTLGAVGQIVCLGGRSRCWSHSPTRGAASAGCCYPVIAAALPYY